jgi:hypothetical protein
MGCAVILELYASRGLAAAQRNADEAAVDLDRAQCDGVDFNTQDETG